MDIEIFRTYVLAKKEVTEETPFGPDTLVYKVMGKAFALCSIDDFQSVNLKCDPERAIDLRERYTGIQPGYHMNKKMWNTVALQEGLDDDFLRALIDHSYLEVVKTFTRKRKRELGIG
jgi:predicted DNA-binding protein (MmcQ/YjbR family)